MNVKFFLNQKRNLLSVTGFNLPAPGWLMDKTLLDSQILVSYSSFFQNLYFELKGYHIENKSYLAATGKKIVIRLIENAGAENVMDIIKKHFPR